MLNYWQSHQEYLRSLHEAKISFDSSQRLRLQTELAQAREKLRLLNLDSVMIYLEPFYSNIGRPASNQVQIIRSLILFFLISANSGSYGLTAWIVRLRNDPVLAALIGCRTDSLPPLGSYFDLMDRLWLFHDKDPYSRSKLFPSGRNTSKPDKPEKKGQKAAERHKDIVKKIASRLESGRDILFNFEAVLQNIFLIAAVRPSVQKGLIPQQNLIVSGDGTCVHTHSNPFGKRFQGCPFSDSCVSHPDCLRHYSDPDAAFGWDSDLNQYFFGYTLYHLDYHNPELKVDLPLLFRFTSAARHDSVNALVALHELRKHAPDISIGSVCLDSANDNYPTYELLQKWGISPFIDLNSRRGRSSSIPDSIRIDKDGTPICKEGHRMVCWGYDSSKHSIKWRCPYALGKVPSCTCPCSDSPYGRTIHTKNEWDIRLYTPVPRGTKEWKSTYNNRTSTERINNRVLNHYRLHSMMIHTKKHYSFMTMIIGICIHLDAWYKMSHV